MTVTISLRGGPADDRPLAINTDWPPTVYEVMTWDGGMKVMRAVYKLRPLERDPGQPMVFIYHFSHEEQVP